MADNDFLQETKDPAYITEKQLNEAQKIKEQLDPKEAPEAIHYLDSEIEDDDSTYEVASSLVNCDKGMDKPRVLFDFIVSLYSDAIKHGDENAMNDLGALYYYGYGCEQDFSKAVYYYDMAAKNGCRLSQENLGYCYYYGRNMPVDYEKAFHYFALGAFDGHLVSLYKIGDMYAHGYYVQKNEREAFHIYERCLETMTKEAEKIAAGPVYLRLGKAFLYGLGTEENAENALFCYQRAELYLYDMVKDGDVMYKKSWQAAIDGQAKAREKLVQSLPTKKDWIN